VGDSPPPIAVSEPMRYALELCRLYAGVRRAIVLVGPVGVGKTTLARELHRLSGRDGPFVEVSAGELTEGLFADTLFGHVEGAYTGARTRRQGVIARASGGTLLIDDLAVMSTPVQEALLRVLEGRRYLPVGADRNRDVDCDLIFAATATPRVLAERGKLVADVASRLGELVIKVPPLRERVQDIMPIARAAAGSFLREHASSAEIEFSSEVEALLRAYGWPENVRELRSVVERAVIHAGRHQSSILIRPPHLPERVRHFDSRDRPGVTLTRDLVERVLEETDGNQSAAARRLGVHRNTIARYRSTG